MISRAALLVLALESVLRSASAQQAKEPPPPPAEPFVHCVCDLSQEFTFWMDGRFFRQYLEGHGKDARNWGSLAELDLSNANLLVLAAGDERLPYSVASLAHVDDFLEQGGAVLALAGNLEAPITALLLRHGAGLAKEPVAEPLIATPALKALVGDTAVEFTWRGGNALALSTDWTPLVTDAAGRPLFAQRTVGKGRLVAATRNLLGSSPDASDPIHKAWITPVLLDAVRGKPIDRNGKHDSTWAEDTVTVGPLLVEHHDGTAPFAKIIADEYEVVRPHLVAITGVEPAPGMIKRLLILPTGGGGFSSGERIAIGAWWGDYPKNRYPMVELIGHEAGHSWVLPHPEPLWNEPIATWLGIQVGRRMGMKEADETLKRQIAMGRRLDPKFDRVDPLAPDAPRDLVWGKSYFVFEELERLHGPGAMAKYFRTKRELLKADRPRYTFDDAVAVWSRAVGEDLFPWFQGFAFSVRKERTGLAGN